LKIKVDISSKQRLLIFLIKNLTLFFVFCVFYLDLDEPSLMDKLLPPQALGVLMQNVKYFIQDKGAL